MTFRGPRGRLGVGGAPAGLCETRRKSLTSSGGKVSLRWGERPPSNSVMVEARRV